MTDGLAMRYVWLGPLETAHLNAEGISFFWLLKKRYNGCILGMSNYMDRYGSTIHGISKTFKEIPNWKKEESTSLINQLEQAVPLDQLNVSITLTMIWIIKLRLNSSLRLVECGEINIL